MGRINGWRRTVHYDRLDHPDVERAVEDAGEAVIAAWRHETADGRVEHVYEPDAERPFRVELTDASVSLEQEGRYATRGEGGSANKDLMRSYP